MATTIDKLFKGYSVKEIEEILLKAAINADKSIKKSFSVVIKSSSQDEKRMLNV